MNSTFTKRRLDLTITLGDGEFGDTVGDTVTLTGLRMTADAVKPGGESMGTLQLRVYGLSQSMMNRLTVIGQIGRMKPSNTVLLAAGDDIGGMRSVFYGTIFNAWADYSSAPGAVFNIFANAGMDLALKPVGATSYQGAADAAVMLADFAKEGGLAFENNGVSVPLSNAYFPGTTLSKIRACARAADINYFIDLGTLAIWPKGSARKGEKILISPETGLIGYPALSSAGMTIQTIFNPVIRIGDDIRVESSIEMARGEFNVIDFSHSLASELSGGPWFTTIQCIQNG
jgi:hypothetical protein